MTSGGRPPAPDATPKAEAKADPAAAPSQASAGRELVKPVKTGPSPVSAQMRPEPSAKADAATALLTSRLESAKGQLSRQHEVHLASVVASNQTQISDATAQELRKTDLERRLDAKPDRSAPKDREGNVVWTYSTDEAPGRRVPGDD